MGFTTLILTVDSVAVSHSTIRGLITISRRENQASVMNVPLMPTVGLQNLDAWDGKTITLVIDSVTAFTGIVDKTEVDTIYKRITLVCSDKRREILNDQTVSAVGFYSDAIFSEVENTIDELEQRLTTIPSVADIKPDGTYAITDMNPKTTPDFTLTGTDIYRNTVPRVSRTSRTRLTNQVNLTFDFRYTRLRHRERGFKITDLSFCDILDLGALGSFTLKTTFLNYANQMDWLLNESSIVWEEMPASTASTAPPCTVDVAYVHNDRFATSLTYDSATRFVQTVTERFNITVKSPQSITQYGTIDWNQNNGYEIEYDAKDWEVFDKYSEPTGGTAHANDYYIDEDGVTADFNNAILTAINIANTKIIKSHRDTQTQFKTDLRLDFDLTDTIELNTTIYDAKRGGVIDFIDSKGKVSSIEHTIDMTNRLGTTETEISQSVAQGTQTPDSLTVPTRPTVSIVSDSWTDPQIMTIATGTVNTPAIDNTSRDEQVVTQAVTYEIEIQDDTFAVTF